MSTTTLTLTDFLLARIAEDEYNARNATGNRWHGQACEVRTDPSGVPGSVEPFWFLVAATGGDNHFRNALHVARWDPARVLAECKAKRAIVEREVNSGTRITFRRMMVLRDLAAVYADHPDYRAAESVTP